MWSAKLPRCEFEMSTYVHRDTAFFKRLHLHNGNGNLTVVHYTLDWLKVIVFDKSKYRALGAGATLLISQVDNLKSTEHFSQNTRLKGKST